MSAHICYKFFYTFFCYFFFFQIKKNSFHSIIFHERESFVCFNHVTTHHSIAYFSLFVCKTQGFYLHININNLDMFLIYMYSIFLFFSALSFCIFSCYFTRNYRVRNFMCLLAWYVSMKLKKFSSENRLFLSNREELKEFFCV